MYYTKLGKHTVNAVHLAEVLQVLVRHGFADLLRRAGFHDGLPARVLRGLNLMDAPSGEPATFGQRTRDALTELGPTFVKFGQILSTRPDLVGSELSKELSSLQDQVSPLPFATMAKVIEEELGGPVDEFFEEFTKEPMASASLSQVYEARLHGGETVAVKVQRPGIEKVIESDLSLMRQIAEWVGERVEETKWLDPPGIVDEFSRSVRRELDFSIEAQAIEQFERNLEEIEDAEVPSVYRDVSTRRVLTMSWIDGVRVDQFEAYEERNCERRAIALLCCDVLCRMVFEDRLFHADPHPGNVFITRDNGMALLDLGMAGHLERSDVVAMADLLLAIFHKDSVGCVDALLNLTTEGVPEDRDGLEHEIAEFIAFEAHSIINEGQVARGIERAIQIVRRFHLQLAPRFSLLLKSLATVEMVGRTLDPELDFVPIVRPFVEDLVLKRYQPQHMMKEAQQNADALLKLSRQLPGDLSSLLQQLRRGKLKFTLAHEDINNLANAVDRSSNRQAVSIITAALIVGSSLLVATNSSLSSLGIGGFVFAGLLGVSLIASILWSRKL